MTPVRKAIATRALVNFIFAVIDFIKDEAFEEMSER
jgi:hypothetical protein